MVQRHQIPRQDIRIASRQPPLGLHRGGHLGHMLRDPLELAKIPARDAGIFELEVVEGGSVSVTVRSDASICLRGHSASSKRLATYAHNMNQRSSPRTAETNPKKVPAS